MEHSFVFNTSSGGGLGVLGVLAILWRLAVTVFWMFVGWRALRAHERLSDATDKIARKDLSSAQRSGGPERT